MTHGQFTIIQTRVLFDKRLKGHDRDILMLLQSMSGLNGYCWPSYNHIADKLGISRRTAINSIKKLCELNYLKKENGTVGETTEQSSNRYYVNNNPDAGVVQPVAPRNEERGVQNMHSGVVQNMHPEIDKFCEKKMRVCARTREEEISPRIDKTESDNMSEPLSDIHHVNCPNSPCVDDIRLWQQISDDWKNTFKNDLFLYMDIIKTKQKSGFCVRKRLLGLKKDFNEKDFLDIYNKHSAEPLTWIENIHYFDEVQIL